MSVELNNVKNRFLPIPESAQKGLEREVTITDFDILKELGSGSFGNVYLVRHKVTKAEYAIKAIDKRNKTNQEEKPYFRREVEVMYKIHHPNVVKLFGHFEDNYYCYFIMEYISKGNVYNLLPTDKKKRLSTKVCSFIIRDVISAVYFLHNMKPKIIHRDIKPENVLLGDGLVAKLTDFGWSNYMQEDEKRTTVCGTPIYLAPEIMEEKPHDEAVDLWCIGVLLFELVTANPPFAGNDLDTLKENVLKLKINWPKDINVDAKNLIMKILKLDPKQRLPLEEMMKHPFITKFTPDAPKHLIKIIKIQIIIYYLNIFFYFISFGTQVLGSSLHIIKGSYLIPSTGRIKRFGASGVNFVIKGCFIISSSGNLCLGSNLSIFIIKFLASTFISFGQLIFNFNTFSFKLSKSSPKNGGLAVTNSNNNTPIHHKSTASS